MKIQIEKTLVEEALDQLKAAQEDCYLESTQHVIDGLEQTLRRYEETSFECNAYAQYQTPRCEEQCDKCGPIDA